MTVSSQRTVRYAERSPLQVTPCPPGLVMVWEPVEYKNSEWERPEVVIYTPVVAMAVVLVTRYESDGGSYDRKKGESNTIEPVVLINGRLRYDYLRDLFDDDNDKRPYQYVGVRSDATSWRDQYWVPIRLLDDMQIEVPGLLQ